MTPHRQNGGVNMIKKLFFLGFFACVANCAMADGLFFADEPVQDGLPVFEMSKTFGEIYEKLDNVNWAGKSLNVAIESLENINPKAHIAATDERIVLVWGDEIVGNFPRPDEKDWYGFGEITTALILKMRANNPQLQDLSQSEVYRVVVDALVAGVDENGRYIFSQAAEIAEDGRLLTSVGIEGFRDMNGNWRVTGVYKGAPADIAGVRAGDLIVQINGEYVANMSDADLNAVMTGFNSGTAKMKLLTPMGDKNVVLRRASIVLADADVIRHTNQYAGGLLEFVVHKVSDNTVNIINEALAQYPDATGIVLDLRTAIGDDERAAAKLAGLFMGAVPVMRIVETARDEVEVVPGNDAVTDTNVVVLMSDMTRGTAEAVVAAFYENNRGVLVGTPTAGVARIASRIDLNNGGALELLNKSLKTGLGRTIDGRGIFPIVCLSNIRSNQQQNAFFLNVINNDFSARDFNKEANIRPQDVRRGCPVVTSGVDEDALAIAVAAKILTDDKIYGRLLAQEEQ